MQLLLLTLWGCTTPGPSYSGHGTYDYLAFDGERTWKYETLDEANPYTLVVEKVAYSSTDGIEEVTMEYSTQDPQQLLGSISWTAGNYAGSGFTGYTIDDEEVIFDNTVIFAKNRMVGGTEVVTETNGMVFTSTLVGLEPCQNNWSSEEWECLHFSVSVDQEDHQVPFVGDWWMANGWGPSIFNVQSGPWAATEDWVLLGAEWAND